MNKINNKNYFVIQGWMLNDFKLKGNDLMVYAIIYGFTQDGKNWFEGSREYIAQFIGCKEVKTVHNILKRLVEQGFLVKDTKTLENNTLFVRYKAVIPLNQMDWLNLDREQINQNHYIDTNNKHDPK